MKLKDKIEKVKMYLANSQYSYSGMFTNPHATRYDDLVETCIKTMKFDGKSGIEEVAGCVIELVDQYYQQMDREAIFYSMRKF